VFLIILRADYIYVSSYHNAFLRKSFYFDYDPLRENLCISANIVFLQRSTTKKVLLRVVSLSEKIHTIVLTTASSKKQPTAIFSTSTFTNDLSTRANATDMEKENTFSTERKILGRHYLYLVTLHMKSSSNVGYLHSILHLIMLTIENLTGDVLRISLS